jgi:putative flippase GtrA
MQPEVAHVPEPGLMGAARSLAHRLHLPTTLMKFLIVGGVGFLINQFFLFVFYDSPIGDALLPPYNTSVTIGFVQINDVRLLISSALAVECAIIFQFRLHERWTFRARRRDGNALIRFAKYNASSAVSPIITVATVTILTPIIRDADGGNATIDALAPYIANTIGVLLGFTWNWTLNSLIIWPHQRKADEDTA